MTLLAGTEAIETERLVLRRIEPSDLGFFTEIHTDPDVARYIGHGQPRPYSETAQWLDDILASYAAAALGQLAVIRKSDGALIGRCGLSDAAIEREWAASAPRKGWFFSAHVPTGTAIELVPELGFTFGKAAWGQGFASEAAGRIYRYVREQRAFAAIMSVIHPENRASLGVARKFGVTYIDQLELAGRVFDRYHWPLG